MDPTPSERAATERLLEDRLLQLELHVAQLLRDVERLARSVREAEQRAPI